MTLLRKEKIRKKKWTDHRDNKECKEPVYKRSLSILEEKEPKGDYDLQNPI